MLNEIGIKVMPFSDSYVGNDIIHIGGPAANLNANSLFVTKLRNIEFFTVKDEKQQHDKCEINTNCIVYTNDDSRGFKVGDIFYPLTRK